MTRIARIARGEAVFGASIDGLVRATHARVGPAGHAALLDLVETWPVEDADGLYHRLNAMASATPPPGSVAGAVLGLLAGGLLGVPLGFLAYLLAREFLLPTRLWSSDAPVLLIGGAVTVGAAVLGAANGWRRSRLIHALFRGLLGFVLGAVLGAIAGLVLAGVVGYLAEVSQREGAFAMGVAFVIMPLAGLVGGIALALRMGRRAWSASSP